MLSGLDLSVRLTKKAYKEEKEEYEKKLDTLQHVTKELKIPIIIVFDGWSASGKGSSIAKLVYPLDPRFFNVYTMDKNSNEQEYRPFMWNYWVRTPTKGQIAIFDKSWIRALHIAKSPNVKESEIKIIDHAAEVNTFEKQITDDGTILIKFFMHVDKEVQKSRFKQLEKNPDTKWRVNSNDWEQNKNYDEILEFYEKILTLTDSENSRWNVIEANDSKFASLKIMKIVVETIEKEIEKRKSFVDKTKEIVYVGRLTKKDVLGKIDPNKEISDKEYKNKLDEYQKEISELGFKLYTKRRPVIIAYEGWDAAGKGGNIKRLTEELDPRSYEVVPISKPSQEELDHNYLWRFYKKFPKDGHLVIFDRSWYGRVLVERVENLCSTDDWKRAYQEINEMESYLVNQGAIMFKFWLQIDLDEQLKRFDARLNNPVKRYKITDEDWRNRDKWQQYEVAVNDMLNLTNTTYAPWTIVEGNNKKFARIKTLQCVTSKLKEQLK